MEENDQFVDTLRSRGLTCAKLKAMEKREYKDAAEFRKIGFQNIANVQEQSAQKIAEVRKKVCKLR
jgi:hypothetical protein